MGKPIFLSGTRNISIGSKVRIYPGARLEADKGKIEIADNTSIGECLHMYSGGGGVLSVGKNTTISSSVLITNVDHMYNQIGVHIMEQPLVYKETKIGNNCFIGHAVCILAGAKIGNNCVIGAHAVVKDGCYPDYSVIAGTPAKVVKQFDIEKEKWIKK